MPNYFSTLEPALQVFLKVRLIRHELVDISGSAPKVGSALNSVSYTELVFDQHQTSPSVCVPTSY